MPDYKKMYFKLFNSLTDVIEELEKHNYGKAGEILRNAQRATEEDYINNEACEETEK